VAQALADPLCLRAVEAFWDEAEANLAGPEGAAADLQIPAYRAALLARFSNARIAHHLAQIAMDGSTKLRMRAVPVLRAERAAGRSGAAAALMIAAWMDYSAAAGEVRDPLADGVAAANRLSGGERIQALLKLVDPVLAADGGVVDLVEDLCGTFGKRAVSR
jgi:fructuronate reductase